MKLTLDEFGRAYADVDVNAAACIHIRDNSDWHISTVSALNAIRAELKKLPVDQRPQVEWFVYGKQIFDVNDDLRSNAMWDDLRTDIDINNIMILL